MNAEVYTKDNCPYCTKAKALLTKHDIAYTELSAVDLREDLIARVTESTGSPPRTVPQIFLDGQYVGGYTELAAKLIGGSLR